MSGAGAEERRDALVERLFAGVLGMIDVHAVYVGDRLGLYRALADGGAATAEEVAARDRHRTSATCASGWSSRRSRHARGLDDAEDPGARRYTLPPGTPRCWSERDSPNYLAPFARMMVGMVRAAAGRAGGLPHRRRSAVRATTAPTSARARAG